VDSFVKNLTGLGKLLATLTISLTLLSACGSTTQNFKNSSYSQSASLNEYYHPANSTVAVALNAVKWKTGMLSDYDYNLQKDAVFFALNTLQNGEVTRWYNGNTGAHGAVKVSMTYPQGSGYCRVIMSQIAGYGKQRNFSETACINSVDKTWRFVR
jgi:surface antigen